MSATVSCPDGAVLSRFSLGQMSEAEIDSLGGHIAQCPDCIRTLDTLSQRDTLLEALAADPKASQGDPTEVVRVVIERLKTRMLAAAESKQAMAPTTTGDAAGDAPEKEPSLEFLCAPEQPDEIGRLGAYRVLKLLGQGGMGLVFQAEDMQLKRRVALKVMRPRLAQKPESCERFLREARAAAAIEHDHIVAIHQVSEANGVPFLAMPWLKGMSLEERLQQTATLPIAEIVRLARQMALGLAAAHARGLIHRDIKPGNIWLETQPDEPGTAVSGGRVKILDFGLAKPLEDASDLTDTARQITQLGAILGTPAYMAPEQARGEAVDARCDLFSLGVVLYRMCTGQLPFQGSTTGAVLMNLAAVQPETPRKLNPEVPAGLSDLIQQLLAKEQVKRPASARDVGQRLLALEQELKDAPVGGATLPVELQSIPSSLVNASTIGERKPVAAGSKSKRRLLVAAAVLLLLIGGGMYALYQLAFNAPHGTILVEIDDPRIEARFKDGELELYGPDDKFLYSIMPSQRSKSVPPGKYRIKITGADGLTLDTEELTLVKGGKRTVRVLLKPLPEAKGLDALPPRYKNNLGMEFALVPKGKAWLGGGGGKAGDKEVEFKDDFYLGVYEVTQEEWARLMPKHRNHFSPLGGGAKVVTEIGGADLKRFPAENLSWDEAQQFLALLNEHDKQGGWVYRLPTEAEWEYACRGGSMLDQRDSAFAYYLDKPTQQLSPDQANHVPGLGLRRTFKVGSFKPNQLGLHDMHGNVWEWCADEIPGKAENPNAAARRVYRGGSWTIAFCGATSRFVNAPSWRNIDLGLRVARVRVAADPDRRGDGFVSLFNGRDFTGWNTYSGALDGWRIAGGELIGSSPTTHLYATIPELENMYLRIEARISAGGLAQAILRSSFTPHAPNGYHLNLSSQDAPQQTGSIQNLGVVAERLHGPDEWVTLEAILQGTQVETRVNGKKAASFYDPRFRSGALALHVPTPGATVRVRKIEMKRLPSTAPPLERHLNRFVTIFDGKSADAWRSFEGDMKGWRLEGGALVSRINSRNLYFDTHYQDFHLRADVLVSKGTKAAIGLRSPFTPDEESPQMYGIIVAGDHPSKAITGSLHGIAVAKPASHGLDEWTTLEAICRGNQITTRVNGQTVLETTDRRFRSGRIFLSNKLGGTFKVRKIEIQEFAPSYTNSLGMEFALIPKGKAWLGGGGGKLGDKEVEFKEDFYLGVYEVTQEEWQNVMGANRSYFSRKGADRDLVKDISDADLKRFPVEAVSWDEAQVFLEGLNKPDQQNGWMYRLPTAAEWEYACRGGPVTGKFHYAFDFYLKKPSNELLPDQANFNNVLKRTCKVGSYQPNPLGLYDMHGNVQEWCANESDSNVKSGRVLRGGFWGSEPSKCRAASSYARPQSYWFKDIGFRVARVRVAADPDRRAAEWVLAIGGSLRIQANGVETSVAKDGKLPDGPFHVITVFAGGLHIKDADLVRFKDLVHLRKLQAHQFFGNKNLTDAGLEHLLGLKGLEELDVYGSEISNVGVERLTIFKNLRVLHLGKTKITDAGLAHVAGLGNLQHLSLSYTRLSNDGLKQLKGLANLESMTLEATQVSDDGLQHLQALTKLQSLSLNGTKVTGAGLDHLKGLRKLKTLYLDLTPTSDDGLSKLKGWTNLTSLGLQGTQVTDAGLEHLKSLSGLEKLNLKKTNVTAANVLKLGAALPRCKIEWDGGVIGPTVAADPDRCAAEWVLSIGGSMRILINGKESGIAKGGKLPDAPFHVVRITVGPTPIGDADLVYKGLPSLYPLKDLRNLKLSGAICIDELGQSPDCPIERLVT